MLYAISILTRLKDINILLFFAVFPSHFFFLKKMEQYTLAEILNAVQNNKSKQNSVLTETTPQDSQLYDLSKYNLSPEVREAKVIYLILILFF
jgi:hypothetical protein